ncbi:hypothetical protein CCR91_02105 [Thiorhodovibrio winogradskyi]|nr:hypothetical protein [Thiorhodovibrio winogradskyi]
MGCCSPTFWESTASIAPADCRPLQCSNSGSWLNISHTAPDPSDPISFLLLCLLLAGIVALQLWYLRKKNWF